MPSVRTAVAVNAGPPPPSPRTIALSSSIVAHPDLRHSELDIERYLKAEQGIKLDSDAQLCPRHCLHLESPSTNPACPLGSSCPLRHSTPSSLNFAPRPTATSQHAKTVCKHWLRGLCKKGRACEFLHEYELRAMPECWFFGKYGFCSNGDECMYLHVDERMRVLECMDYRRGFCPKGARAPFTWLLHFALTEPFLRSAGPACAMKHIRRPVCPLYLNGFCPLGPECFLGHPKLECDPTPRGNPYFNSFNPFDRPKGDPDRGVGAPRGGRGNPRLAQRDEPRNGGQEEESGWVHTDAGPRRKRNLDDVTCFKVRLRVQPCWKTGLTLSRSRPAVRPTRPFRQ